LATIICTASALAEAGDTLAKIRETQTITIAYREASLPFSYLDDKKKPIGYAIDLCLKIADAVKR
jgi:glutamate/aspartate transport system substrate-binding protein